jgi:aryl-alcohol dehydrogenase-like predicted oxidoreductase
MQYRFLGRTGVRVSELALGTMSFGGDADRDAAQQMYCAARDAGINTFDCADVYNGGVSEQMLGDFIAHERDAIVLMSKAYFPTSDDPNARGASRRHVSRAVDASLRRLRTDRLDVLFLHRFDDHADLEEVLRGVEHLVAAGKVLYPAFSNYAAWQVAKALGIQAQHGWARAVCIQPMYNLVKRQAEVELLPMAASEQLGVFPYSPLGGGLLTGRYTTTARPPHGRLVDNAMYATRYAGQGPLEVAEHFTALAAELGVDPVSLAVRWVGTHPAVTAPLIGARHVEQLRPALASVGVAMDEALRTRIAALSPTPPPATDRNEEATAHNYGSR